MNILSNFIGNANPGDWWTALESEPSLSNISQGHQTTLRGPEFAQCMMETEGPFNNINRGIKLFNF